MRRFWAVRGKHFGGKWHIFTTLSECERKIAAYQVHSDKSFEQVQLVEISPDEVVVKRELIIGALTEAIYYWDECGDLETVEKYQKILNESRRSSG